METSSRYIQVVFPFSNHDPCSRLETQMEITVFESDYLEKTFFFSIFISQIA